MSNEPTTNIQLPDTMVPFNKDTGVLWAASKDAAQHAMWVARVYKQSKLVPEHLTESAILIGMDIAIRTGQNPLSVLQAMYEVKGRPGWSATYLIARARQLGHAIGWEVVATGEMLQGIEEMSVTAFFEDKPERRITVSSHMAVAEGWTKNAKYQTMPELMLRYRAATMLTRLYLPEVTLGLATAEELQDTPQQVRVVEAPVDNGAPVAGPAALAAVLQDATASGELAAKVEASSEVDGEWITVEPDADQRAKLWTSVNQYLEGTFTPEQAAEAKRRAGVAVLRSNASVGTLTKLLDACAQVMSEKWQALPPEPTPAATGTITRAELRTLFRTELDEDQRFTICEEVGVPWGDKVRLPKWRDIPESRDAEMHAALLRYTQG